MMKNKIISLLKEIKTTCEKENIDFFISGELALHTYREEEIDENFNNATIMVFAKDIERLNHALTKVQYRTVESLLTNRKFPGYYLRYMDENTTLINYGDSSFNYNTNGIGIDIEIICSVQNNTYQAKMLNALKRTWVRKYRANYLKKTKKLSKRKKIKRIIANTFLSIAGSAHLMKKLFVLWTFNGKMESKTVQVALNKGELVTFDSSLFDSKSNLNIEGEIFPFVENLDAFIEATYQNSFKLKPKRYDIFDTTVPWSQYKTVLEHEDVKLIKIQNKQQRYVDWKKRIYNPLYKKRLYYYSFLFCSEDRMRCHRMYTVEKKNRILNLYSQEKYNQIKDEMDEYLMLVKDYDKQGIGFCFDSNMFEIAMHLLVRDAYEESRDIKEYNKKCKKVIRIIENVPVEHFDSIDNIFWGQREEKSVLQKKKDVICKRIIQVCDKYEKMIS